MWLTPFGWSVFDNKKGGSLFRVGRLGVSDSYVIFFIS